MVAGVASLDPFEAAARLIEGPRVARAAWLDTARPNQLTPAGAWNAAVWLAGRGFGKTRTGAEDIAYWASRHPGTRIALVGPTFADARDTMVEGESGLLSVLERYDLLRTRNGWNRSLGELFLKNGCRMKLFSGDEPDRLRGPQHHRAWVDELATFQYPEAWDQLLFGLRLGDRPQAIITTTPRPTVLIRELIAREDVHVTRGSTFDNAAHLAPAALAQLRERYDGTRLGRQELYAELLLDTPGALVTLDMIDKARVKLAPTVLQHVLVGVDPAITATERSDETGIVVVGQYDTHLYVLEDQSAIRTPDGWGRAAITAWVEWEADGIVYETNQGGDLVKATIVQAYRDMRAAGLVTGPEPRLIPVHASRGKRVRAEPVAALYEQARIHHVGSLAHLEDEWTSWTTQSKDSPDRMDAMVWAATVLLDLAAPVTGGGRFPISA